MRLEILLKTLQHQVNIESTLSLAVFRTANLLQNITRYRATLQAISQFLTNLINRLPNF